MASEKKSMDPKVRNGIIIGAVAVVALVLSMIFLKPASRRSINDYTAPAVSGIDVLGRGSVALSELKGKVVLINFWATWCPPCRAEIPDLIRLQETYANDFVVLGVSLDREGVEVVSQFVREQNMNYPVVMGDEALVNSYGGVSAIPTSFVVDRQGDLVSKIVGARSYADFEKEIMPYLQKQ